MKKYLVIGNPIEHSFSPKLHNFWIKNNNINAIYEKKKLDNNELEKLFLEIREEKIAGINITVPFKKSVIPFIDLLSDEANQTQSVNTVYLENNKIIGHNTDIDGFKLGIKNSNFAVEGKKIFILGAGGVVPSIISALKKMNVSQIILSNRTKEKAENLKGLFEDLKIVEWGEVPTFDMIINATSLGLNINDKINLDFSKIEKGKFFYDVIYNPSLTSFLEQGKRLGHKIENGKMMFIYQAYLAFKIWHGIYPNINDEIINLLEK